MSESEATVRKQAVNWFWSDVGADVKDALTTEQRSAIEQAVTRSAANAQPADVRLHLGKYFVRITAGKERRNRERLKQDLIDNPIFASKNAPLIAIFWTLTLFSTLYVVAFIVNALSRFVFV